MRYPFLRRQHTRDRRLAFTVAAAFAAAGLAWVFFTDHLLYSLTLDPALIARIETAKGWLFIGFATALIYLVAERGARRLQTALGTLETIIDGAADGVLVISPARAIVNANPAALRLLGCSDGQALDGLSSAEFARRYRVSYGDGSRVPADAMVLQRAFDSREPLQETLVVHPPGAEPRVLSVTAAAVATDERPDGALVVGVLHDVTEADRFERMRDRFLSAAAHALKTPLTVIKTHAQLLARSDLPELAPATAAIGRQCDHMERLVQNLLVLARLRSRTLELEPAKVALAGLLERAVRVARRLAPLRPMNVTYHDEPLLFADQERLTMVLNNLLTEALDASAPEAPLEVDLKSHDEWAELTLRVAPLRPEERLLDGLPEHDVLGVEQEVSQRVVEAHGGSLERHETPEQLMIRLRLPRLTGDASQEPAA